jgi:hypothetical protein
MMIDPEAQAGPPRVLLSTSDCLLTSNLPANALA